MLLLKKELVIVTLRDANKSSQEEAPTKCLHIGYGIHVPIMNTLSCLANKVLNQDLQNVGSLSIKGCLTSNNDARENKALCPEVPCHFYGKKTIPRAPRDSSEGKDSMWLNMATLATVLVQIPSTKYRPLSTTRCHY